MNECVCETDRERESQFGSSVCVHVEQMFESKHPKE